MAYNLLFKGATVLFYYLYTVTDAKNKILSPLYLLMSVLTNFHMRSVWDAVDINGVGLLSLAYRLVYLYRFIPWCDHICKEWFYLQSSSPCTDTTRSLRSQNKPLSLHSVSAQSVRIFPRPSPQKSQIGAQRFICIFVYFNLIKMRVGCRRWRNPRLIAARGFWIHVRATSCEWIVYGKHLFTWFESARHWNWVFNSRRRVYFVQQRSHFLRSGCF